MIIDSHQHFWHYDPVRDAWIDESMRIIARDFLPKDLKPILKESRVEGCVAVQADQSEEETHFLLSLAVQNPFVKGVVGWVDLKADDLPERLAYFSKNPLFKGVRHILQAEKEGYMLQDSFLNGISLLKDFNLTYDILIYPHQIKEAIELVKKNPEQPFVIDHLAKPYIKDKKIKQWASDIKQLAAFEKVHCKLSGMITEADWNHWQSNDFNDFMSEVLEAFGTDRIMFGSDWPVCLLAGSYPHVIRIVEDFIQNLSPVDRNKIMGENARNFYRLQL